MSKGISVKTLKHCVIQVKTWHYKKKTLCRADKVKCTMGLLSKGLGNMRPLLSNIHFTFEKKTKPSTNTS